MNYRMYISLLFCLSFMSSKSLAGGSEVSGCMTNEILQWQGAGTSEVHVKSCGERRVGIYKPVKLFDSFCKGIFETFDGGAKRIYSYYFKGGLDSCILSDDNKPMLAFGVLSLEDEISLVGAWNVVKEVITSKEEQCGILGEEVFDLGYSYFPGQFLVNDYRQSIKLKYKGKLAGDCEVYLSGKGRSIEVVSVQYIL